MTVRTKNYARQVIAQIEEASNEGLNAAASFYVVKLRETVNKPYPPASKPGEAPHRRTRWGQKHIRYTRAIGKTQGARIGIDISEVSPVHKKTAIYMIMHELGKRPWMIPTLLRWLKQIGEVAVARSKAKLAGAA